jgi:hypothetical protein
MSHGKLQHTGARLKQAETNETTAEITTIHTVSTLPLISDNDCLLMGHEGSARFTPLPPGAR